MTTILAIDVGPERSAYCCLSDGSIGNHGWVENEVLRDIIITDFANGIIVLESPQAQDKPLGKLLRDTIWWAGRFAECADACGCKLIEAEERDVAFWLTGNRSANNPAVLQSLKDFFGDKTEQRCDACGGLGKLAGSRGLKNCQICKARGIIKLPGPIASLNEHERSALAAAWWYWKRTHTAAARASNHVQGP